MKLTIGRRILAAFPASILLALLFYILCSIAVGVLPGVFPTLFPQMGAALGFIAGVADQMITDLYAKAEEKKA